MYFLYTASPYALVTADARAYFRIFRLLNNVSFGSKTVALKADTLTFAQADKTLISTQTKAEIEAK